MQAGIVVYNVIDPHTNEVVATGSYDEICDLLNCRNAPNTLYSAARWSTLINGYKVREIGEYKIYGHSRERTILKQRLTIWMIDEFAKTLEVGSRVEVKKEDTEDGKSKPRYKRARIIEKYPNIFTVKYHNGLTESFQYQDLIQKDGIKLLEE